MMRICLLVVFGSVLASACAADAGSQTPPTDVTASNAPTDTAKTPLPPTAEAPATVPAPTADAAPAATATTEAFGEAATPAPTAAREGSSEVQDSVSARVKLRFMVKPISDSDDDALTRAIESATGRKVVSIKKSMRTWRVVELAPAAGDADAAQTQAAAQLKATGLFASVEADRLMQAH